MGGWDNNISWDDKKPDDDKLIKDQIKYIEFVKKQKLIVDEISSSIKLPENKEQIRIITKKGTNAFALLIFLLEKTRCEELIITTYNVNTIFVSRLEQILNENNIKKVTIVLSQFFTNIKREVPWVDKLINLAERKPAILKLIFCRNHSKIIGIKTIENKYYVIEGSGNMTSGGSIEQYLIEQSEEMYLFHKEWIEKIYLTSNHKNAKFVN